MADIIDPEHLLHRKFGQDLEIRRWFILLAFSTFSISNAIIWTTYPPISVATAQYYSITQNQVLQFSDSYLWTYLAFSFFGSWLAYKWFQTTLISAMILNALGAWVRFFAGTSYGLALTGQYLSAMSQNVVLFVPVLIADRWFSAAERTWAVTIATLANFFGWGFGFMFSTVLVQKGIEQIHYILLYTALIALVPLIIGVFAIRERPAIPPSYSAFVKMTDHGNFWQEMIDAAKNVKFMLASVCFGNLLGQSYTLFSVIVLFIPNFSLMEQGIVGVIFTTSGIIGGLVATAYLNLSKTEKYDPLIRILTLLSLVSLIILAWLVRNPTFTGICVINALLGIGLFGFQPFAYQAAAEMTFPVQDSISVNFMVVIGQIFGLIGNHLSTASIVGKNGILALVALLIPFAIYIVCIHKTETKRQQAENKHKRIEKEEVESIVSSIQEIDEHSERLPLKEE